MKKSDYIIFGICAALITATVLVLAWPHHCAVSAETPVLDKLMPCLIEQQPIYPRIVTEPAKTSLGEFRVTVYTPYDDGGVWGYETASGTTSEHLRTCAVDPEVIPLGTELTIKGEKMSLTVKAVDTGSAVKGKRIDVFFDGSVEEAMNFVEFFGDYGEVIIHDD